MIESGRSNVPIDKIAKLVDAYGLDGEFAMSIVRELHPDIWKLIVDIVTLNKKAFANMEKLESSMDESLKSKLGALGLDSLIKLMEADIE